MTDTLRLLVAKQADERIRLTLDAAGAIARRLPSTLSDEMSTELREVMLRLEACAAQGQAAAARGDAFAAMPAAVECERLVSRLESLLAAAVSPEEASRWLEARVKARNAEQRRAELERLIEAERAERQRAEDDRIRRAQEERRRVLEFFRARLGSEDTELPDDEQLDVIRHDDGHLLVTARAGAGKTRALTYRAVYLAEQRMVDASRILLLAFNREAAAEMAQRVESMGTRVPHVMTFHAFAKALAGTHGDILTDDEDDQGFSRLREHLAGITAELEAAEPLFRTQLRGLMLSLARDLPQAPAGAVETIDGQWVAASQHKLLWDFFFEHGLQPVAIRGQDAAPGQEKPILAVNCGATSLAVSLGDSLRSTFDAGATERRCQVQLTRPSTAELRDVVHGRWRGELSRIGLAMAPMHEQQLWQRVKLSLRREFVRAVTTYVLRMRNQGLDDEARRRLVHRHQTAFPQERVFLGLAEQVFERYAARIATERIIDFQELILRAAQRVRSGHTAWTRSKGSGDVRRLRYLMIDEFQDVSPLLMSLVDAIRSVNPSISVMGVGDDWQAINGFAGATTEYFQDFPRHFPGASHLNLRTNYRSVEPVVGVGNAVMAGRGLPASAGRRQPGLVAVADLARFAPVAEERVRRTSRMAALRRLAHRYLSEGKTVALLSRTRQPAGLGNRWGEEFRRDLHPLASQLSDGTTVHQYKG